MNRMGWFAAVASCGVVASASAQLHSIDVIVGLDTNDTLATGRVIGGEAVFPACVFTVGLNSSGEAVDPGFNSELDTFSPSTDIGLNMLGALRYWNGSSFDIAESERLGVSFGPVFSGPCGLFRSADTDTAVCGFGVGVTSNGDYHTHFKHTLFRPEGGPLTPGVYMLEFELWATPPSITTSEPFWFLYSYNADPLDVIDAQEYVQTNIAWCTPSCVADTTTTGAGPEDAGFGVADGFVDPDDLAFYINEWIAGDAGADVTTTGQGPSDPLFGVSDEQVDPDDLAFYINAWLEGCS